MELNEVILAYPQLGKLSKVEELPMRLKYKIFTLMKEMEPSVKFFEEQRTNLINKYGKTDSEGKTCVLPEDIEKFTNDALELEKTEIDTEFTKGEINLDTELPLTAVELSTLAPFFDFVG